MRQSFPPSFLNFRTIVTASIFWALLAFYFAVTFGIPIPGQEIPKWYTILSYIFDGVALIGTSLLCWRNWLCPIILSSGTIWLLFALRSLLYLVANGFFGYWELVLERFPNVSLADPIYVASYLALLWGMLLAVVSRRVKLKAWQYGAIAIVTALAVWIAWLVSNPPDNPQTSLVSSSVVALSVIAQKAKAAPQWVLAVETTLAPLALTLGLLYVVSDIILAILSSTLVLTFWGGRFSQTWAIVAAAALLLYFADVRYAYVIARGNFETGSLFDILWVFSNLLLGIGAAWEYEISVRSRSR